MFLLVVEDNPVIAAQLAPGMERQNVLSLQSRTRENSKFAMLAESPWAANLSHQSVITSGKPQRRAGGRISLRKRESSNHASSFPRYRLLGGWLVDFRVGGGGKFGPAHSCCKSGTRQQVS